MDFYVSRAMQISCLEIGQINDLHDIERGRGSCLANWNIQNIFNLPTIKERWCISDDGAAQEGHANRVRTMLLSQKVAQNETEKRVNADGKEETFVARPWEAITTGRLDSTHAYDARVYDAIQAGQISFTYEGSASTGNRLRDRVTAGRRRADVLNEL